MIKLQSNGLPWMQSGLTWIVVSKEYEEMNTYKFASLAAVAVTAMAGWQSMAVAQGAAADDQSRVLEEIVVSASRRGAVSLQDLPISVSAIAADDISRQGVDGIVDIVKSVPSINVIQVGPGQTQFTIRGVASGPFAPTETGDRPLVSVYFDDVPISIQGYNPDLKVFDLERVEILRGPQGTLFGAGSMAGTVRYITRKPSVDAFDGSFETVLSTTAEAGDPNWNIRGLLNVPLSDNTAFLGTFYQGQDAGFIDNASLGIEDANSVETTQFRVAIRYAGSGGLTTLDASVLYSQLESDGTTNAYEGFPAYTYDTYSADYNEDDFSVANITAEFSLGDMTLISASSLLDREVLFHSSGSYEALTAGIFRLAWDDRPLHPGTLVNNIETFTQEFRLVSPSDQALTWQVGAFYEDTDRQYDQENFALAGPTGGFPGIDVATELPSQFAFGTPSPNTIFLGTHDISESQIALFFDLNYAFTDSVGLTIGGRYFDFEQDFTLEFTGIAGSGFALNPSGPPPLFLPLTQEGAPEENGFNPRAVLSIEPDDDTLFFAEVSQGFRYGSVNEPVASDFCAGLTGPATVGSDSLTNYAVGIKRQSTDRSVTINATAFFIDWEDVQSRFNLDCGYYYRVNEGSVRSTGIEFESLFQLTDSWSLSLNGGYTKAEAQEDVFTPPAFSPEPGVVALAGQKTPLFPELIAAASARYNTDLRNGADLTFRAAYQYRDEFGNAFDTENLAYRITPDQSLVNVSVSYVKDNWEVGFFGTNLANDENFTFVQSVPRAPADGPQTRRFYGRPRTLGIRANLSF